jgi:hypothetical protein
MKISHTHLTPIFVIFVLAVFTVISTKSYANPSQDMIELYNQGASGDTDAVEQVHQQLLSVLKKEGKTPLTLIYLGSSETLLGRDAWMPWKKMAFTERGLARMDKALTLLLSTSESSSELSRVNGLLEPHLVKAMAASTFTSVPDLFNHFDRGYELYGELLNDSRFKENDFSATAWVYYYGVIAALRAEEISQATRWLQQMQQKNSDHPFTRKAQQAVLEEAV